MKIDCAAASWYINKTYYFHYSFNLWPIYWLFLSYIPYEFVFGKVRHCNTNSGIPSTAVYCKDILLILQLLTSLKILTSKRTYRVRGQILVTPPIQLMSRRVRTLCQKYPKINFLTSWNLHNFRDVQWFLISSLLFSKGAWIQEKIKWHYHIGRILTRHFQSRFT
jgi:hypothetical protein